MAMIRRLSLIALPVVP